MTYEHEQEMTNNPDAEYITYHYVTPPPDPRLVALHKAWSETLNSFYNSDRSVNELRPEIEGATREYEAKIRSVLGDDQATAAPAPGPDLEYAAPLLTLIEAYGERMAELGHLTGTRHAYLAGNRRRQADDLLAQIKTMLDMGPEAVSSADDAALEREHWWRVPDSGQLDDERRTATFVYTCRDEGCSWRKTVTVSYPELRPIGAPRYDSGEPEATS